MGGIALTFLATIPILNLIAPFWGIVLMLYVFHRAALQARRNSL